MSLVEEARSRAPSIHEMAGIEAGKKTGRCPLHDDSSPSFSISPDGRKWKCFAGCGSGDVFDLLERLQGLSLGEVLRSVDDGQASRRSSIARPKAKTPAELDPEKHRTVMALWIKARARIEDGDSQAARYLAARIGEGPARGAIERQLVGDTDGLAWNGRKIGYPYSLAIPLMAIPEPGQEQDERPVDLVRRRIVASASKKAKVLSLEGAAPGLAKAFGSVIHALQRDRLIVVEGAVNWVSWAIRGELAIGLHGATTAARVADELRGWLDWHRERGWPLPSKMVIDTDREHERDPGIEAARLFAMVGAEFGMSIKAIKRGEGL
jgi:hypothetical protein